MKKVILLPLLLLTLSSRGCSSTDAPAPTVASLTDQDSVIREEWIEQEQTIIAKPVIYLYPETPTEVTVSLDYDGTLLTTYPKYTDGGWSVYAETDGTLTDKDGNEYSYLFWDGTSDVQYDFSEGFVIKGSEAADFFREKLSLMGLTPREYNEFIVYWLPQIEPLEYVLVSFQGRAYTDVAKLSISPEPDNILRVFAAMKPLDKYVEAPEQRLDAFKRSGFTVIEWGGSVLKP